MFVREAVEAYSWLSNGQSADGLVDVAPENFSDHPGAPWYGASYLSECLDILTKNPEVWRKTIFVLCCDENDGLPAPLCGASGDRRGKSG